MICPNINLKKWKSLVSTQGENLSYYLWNKFGGNVPNEYYKKPQVEEDKINSFRNEDNYGVFLEKGDGKIYQSLYHLEPKITEEKIKTIYDNYVKLMDSNKNRIGKSISYDVFKSLLDSYQVFNYKDTYIFGQYNNDKQVFISRINSSTNSKELLAEAIPFISKNFDVVSFLPEDMRVKYERSGYTSSDASFEYDFKGELMNKFALFSNPDLPKKLFKKDVNEISPQELKDFNNIPLQNNTAFYKAIKSLEILGSVVQKSFKLQSVTFKNKYEKEDNYYSSKLKEEGLTDEEIGYIFNWIDKLDIQEAKSFNQIFTKIQIAELHGGVLKDAKILSEIADSNLETQLIKWASQFGIEVRSIEEFRKRTGKDAIAVADVLNKIIYYNSESADVTTFPEEISHFYVEMLGSRHPLFKEAYDKIRDWSEYNSIYEEYKEVYTREDGTPDIFKIKKEAIGKAISQRIVGKQKAKKSKFWQSIDNLIQKIKSTFGGDISKFNIELIADEIATDILTNTNKYLGFGSFEGATIPSNFELKTFEETVSKNPQLLEITDKVSKMGGLLTGSLAYRKQGTTYRKTSETIHDLDFKIPFETHNTKGIEEFIKEASESFNLVRSVKTNGEYLAWYDKSGRYNSVGYVGGTRVLNWKELGYKNEGETIWLSPEGVELNEPRLLETGELAFDGISVDFFFGPESSEIEVDSDNYVIWTNAFKEKMKMGRDKDAFDYRTFIPLPEFRDAKIRDEFLYYQQPTNKITITPELLNRITEIIPAVRRTKKKIKIVEPEILSQSIETQSFSKSKPSGLKVLNAFAQELTKANPDINVEFLTTEELSAKGIKNAKIVRGMAESDSNTIYINTDIAATSDLLHEFGHLLLQQLETVDSELYNSMVTAALEHPHAQSIARSYPELSEKRLGEEVFVTLLGEMAIEKVKTTEEKSWWNKFTDLFNSIVDKLFNITTRGSFKKSILDYSPEEVLKTPLEDVINVFAKDVLKGSLKVIQPKPKTELQRITKDLKTLRDCI